MGLFSRKKKESQESERIREPVAKLDRSAYIGVDETAEEKPLTNSKGDVTNMAETTKTAAKAAAPAKEAAPAKKSASAKKQYVLPHKNAKGEQDGWQVKLEGSTKATRVFQTKAEAEAFAKELAKKQGTDVKRQKKDGKFQKD